MQAVNRPALGVALAAAVVTIPAVYAVLRAYDVLFVAEPNPAIVSASVKIAMFWRVWIAAYVAPVVAIAVHQIARRDLARGARILHVSVLVVAAMIGVQGIFLP